MEFQLIRYADYKICKISCKPVPSFISFTVIYFPPPPKNRSSMKKIEEIGDKYIFETSFFHTDCANNVLNIKYL